MTGFLGPDFPNLKDDGFSVKSRKDKGYNCIAWAAKDCKNWWEPLEFPQPGYYWPADKPLLWTLDNLVLVFQNLGYALCDSADLEPGFEKVAIYVDLEDKPTHMARQRKSGRWTSKLGEFVDIDHTTPGGLEGPFYGRVARILKKRR
jgi:hypothetical protein